MGAQEKSPPGLREAFSQVKDPRRLGGNPSHQLLDIMVMGLCSIATGGKGFNAMADFALAREDVRAQYI